MELFKLLKFNSETVLKITGMVFTLITIFIGIHEYRTGIDLEFRKPFYAQQILVYNELLEVCSQISTYNIDSIHTTNFLRLENKLKELYYGRLNLYQNEMVESRTNDFIISLERFKRNDESEEFVDNDAMKFLAFQIAQACRSSMAKTFNIQLKNLEFNITALDSLSSNYNE